MDHENRISTTEYGYKVFENPPSQESLNEYYSQMYYQNPQGTYQAEYNVQEQTQRKLRIELLEDFVNLNSKDFPKEGRKFLDVGCGEGFVLSHFKSIGWEVTGLDFSTHGARRNNPDIEQFIIQGDVYVSLENLKASELKFHGIFLGNILEHVLNPEALIDSIYPLLKEGGLLCITVPNDFSILQNYLIEGGEVSKPYWLAFPDHLNYFDLQSLTNLLNARELPVIDHFADFPIEWFLVNPQSNYVSDISKGKSAHNSRVILDSMINESTNAEAKRNFWRSLSALGFGRSINTISRKP
jgi:2-polyprenyl-3-methyl-5-hydroxy-6-metoxy-1,4-benzoquinol methylase